MNSKEIKELLSSKGILSELEFCRDKEEAIKLLKCENLWGVVVDYPELEALKESYENGKIEADGSLSLSQLDKVAGGGGRGGRGGRGRGGRGKQSLKNRKVQQRIVGNVVDRIVLQVEDRQTSDEVTHKLGNEEEREVPVEPTQKPPEERKLDGANIVYLTDSLKQIVPSCEPTQESLVEESKLYDENVVNLTDSLKQRQAATVPGSNTGGKGEQTDLKIEEHEDDYSGEDEGGNGHNDGGKVVIECEYKYFVDAGSLYKEEMTSSPGSSNTIVSTKEIHTDLDENGNMVIESGLIEEGTKLGVPYIVRKAVNGKSFYRTYDKDGNRTDKIELDDFHSNPSIKLYTADRQQVLGFEYWGQNFDNGVASAVFVETRDAQ